MRLALSFFALPRLPTRWAGLDWDFENGAMDGVPEALR